MDLDTGSSDFWLIGPDCQSMDGSCGASDSSDSSETHHSGSEEKKPLVRKTVCHLVLLELITKKTPYLMNVSISK